MRCNSDKLTLFMESKVREIISKTIEKISVLSPGKIEDVCLIRSRKGKFIWHIALSGGKKIFVKAVKPCSKNLSEIKLYGKNPEYLRSFLPTVYGVIKKYGYCWILLEELKQLPSANISFEDFKKPIEFMAFLHAKFYSNSSVINNKEIDWAPCFKRQWQNKMNSIRFIMLFAKYMWYFETRPILQKDAVFLKTVIKNSKETFSSLLDAPHSLIHGCFEYHHLYTIQQDSIELKELRLIDWENVSFAPITLDLVYLIEKSIDCGINDTMTLSKFRNECLNYYCSVMKNYSIDIEETKFRNLYNLTFAFKIITHFIFEELKKIKKGNSSNYNFYRNQLFVLDESLNLIR
ncbi:MAG: hypothetical protein KJ887_01580 [Candidatus Omnitrophica bacterium]|nr:hypothetical protein [Candidatus Omnitrophota bacterium]MBU1047350.1 hypothetical protein [Candidatus Omnitrophota bacterium]MBU1889065.1 hypothetical protein [Candidatus Omnitrophota bacterium]